MELNNTCNNCDYEERIKQFRRGKNLVYGKHRIDSYQYYDIIDKDDNIDKEKVKFIYRLFLYNLKVLTDAKVFKINWLTPDQMIPATKSAFWDWTNEDELNKGIESFKLNGLYFPIFTLPKGVPHNQINIPDNMENLYNAYNGNHRIDIIKHVDEFKDNRFMTIEIPPFCEKSCTGFKYTPLVYDADGPVGLPSDQLINPVKLFHLNRCEDEMKINLTNYKKECYDVSICDGVDLVEVRDYQLAFRILQEFQNVLEYPLTRYFEKYGNTLVYDYADVMTTEEQWEGFFTLDYDMKRMCPLNEMFICSICDVSRNEECSIAACCVYCHHSEGCKNICPYVFNKDR